MIYVRLTGGLGNQLFQLAAALQMQKKTGQEIRMYIDHLENYDRPYPFMLNEALDGQLVLGKPPGYVRMISRYRFNKILPSIFPWNINSINLADPPKSKFYLLDDYFQDTTKMGEALEELAGRMQTIRDKDDTLKTRFNELLNGLSPGEVAAVHIRRADYLSKKNRKVFYYLDNEYYRKAIAQLPGGIKRLVVFSESDTEDLSQVTDKDIVYVKGTVLTAVQEFYLMSMFSNIIIGNSTFSFWSSFLPKSSTGVRIGPGNWTYLKNEAAVWLANLQQFSYILQ